MKKNLVYDVHSDMMYMTPEGLMEHRVQFVEFKKRVKDGEDIRHKARIITYVDLNKKNQKSECVRRNTVLSCLSTKGSNEISDR